MNSNFHNTIQISKKCRYSTYGDVHAKKLIFVLHGYGQLSDYFIRKFEILSDLGFYIVAPEATHRFYLRETSGRVGASWMTKEWRETDIIENFSYLETLYDNLNTQNYETITILGFSQGGSTAARWVFNTEKRVNQLILWASSFPVDIDYTEKKHLIKKFVIGLQDQFFSPENLLETIDFYKKINFSIFQYHGKHDIDEKTLLLLLKN